MERNKMKNKKFLFVVATALIIFALAFTLCACSRYSGSDAQDDINDISGTYYAVKDGKFDADDWFRLSSDGTWVDCNDDNGTWIKKNNVLSLTHYITLDAVMDGDTFYLIVLDEPIEYVKRDHAPETGEVWSDKYVILLDTDGGATDKLIYKYRSGEKINLPVPEKEDYKFKGWYDFFKRKYATGSSMPSQNIVLTAKWDKKVTAYSDEYVFFSPAIEGKKQTDLYYYNYSNITKYIYVELTCDSLGGKLNVGMSNNFDLLSHKDMEYYVQNPEYQLKWYYGDWSKPNGSQTFTLGYGSNIQLLAVENSQGQIQCRYLLDFYVKKDCEVKLYNSVSASKPYTTVRGYIGEMVDEYELEQYKMAEFDFDYWLCYDSLIGAYVPFDFTTELSGSVELYQSLKAVDVAVDLDGGTMEETSLHIKPFEIGQEFPVPEKEGYDFIGWLYSTDTYFASYEGKQLYAVSDMPHRLTASYAPKKYFADVDGDTVQFVDTEVTVSYDSFHKKSSIEYSTIDSDYSISYDLFEIGDECNLSVSYGYAVEGWYDGNKRINDDGKNVILEENLLGKTLTRKTVEIFNLEKNIDVAGVVSYEGGSIIGSETTIIAESTDGFKFLGWYDGDVQLTDKSSYTFNLTDEIKTYTAKWDTVYTVPSDMTYIYDNQFKNWDFLTDIVISDGVTSIGNYAFKGCTGLTSVTIPDSVTSIGSNAFYDCSNLTDIYYMGDVAGWCGISGLDNIMSSSRTLYIGGNKVEGDLVIPDSVTSIGQGAFNGCSGLTSVTIPDSVTSIGGYAFKGCTGLTSITFEDRTPWNAFWGFENEYWMQIDVTDSSANVQYLVNGYRSCFWHKL